MADPENPNQIIRKKALAVQLGVSTVTLWRLQRRNELPPSIRISKAIEGWRQGDITAWIEKRSVR